MCLVNMRATREQTRLGESDIIPSSFQTLQTAVVEVLDRVWKDGFPDADEERYGRKRGEDGGRVVEGSRGGGVRERNGVVG